MAFAKVIAASLASTSAAVFFTYLLLGGNPKTPGSISRYAAAKPNLLNVALTRAQRRIYVIGDRDHWRKHQYFSDLADMLPVETVEAAVAF